MPYPTTLAALVADLHATSAATPGMRLHANIEKMRQAVNSYVIREEGAPTPEPRPSAAEEQAFIALWTKYGVLTDFVGATSAADVRRIIRLKIDHELEVAGNSVAAKVELLADAFRMDSLAEEYTAKGGSLFDPLLGQATKDVTPVTETRWINRHNAGEPVERDEILAVWPGRG